MADPRAERLAANEAMFRVANERMADWEERHRDEAVENYLCECANPACTERVGLTKADYERVRSDSCRFLLVSGHEVPDIETVIERNGEWLMIEKDPEVSEIVEDLDPRA